MVPDAIRKLAGCRCELLRTELEKSYNFAIKNKITGILFYPSNKLCGKIFLDDEALISALSIYKF